MRYLARLLALMPAAVACVHTNAAVVEATNKLAPICPNGVKVFPDTAGVPPYYQEIALLNSSGASLYTTESGMIKNQRKKAASLGANGIVLHGFREPSAFVEIVGGAFAKRKGAALAIRIPGSADSIRVASACDGTKNRPS
jgi:hypothetical protein